MTSHILCLIATIPQRRASCERLLRELTEQTQRPDGVILCMDGYGDAPAPPCQLPVREYRTAELSGGPGHKWRVITDCEPDDILICIDDDTTLRDAPGLIRALVAAVEQGGGAAAAMGRLPDGRRAPPGDVGLGRLIYGAGCGLALRAWHVIDLQTFNDYVRDAGGPDALGPLGDDDALVSALLDNKRIPIEHAATGNIYAAPGTQESSQTRLRRERGGDPLAQKRAISRITGWPWVDPPPEVEHQSRPMTWEGQESAVPPGAFPARGEAPPPGHHRVLVMDDAQPQLNGVYDVPIEPSAA